MGLGHRCRRASRWCLGIVTFPTGPGDELWRGVVGALLLRCMRCRAPWLAGVCGGGYSGTVRAFGGVWNVGSCEIPGGKSLFVWQLGRCVWSHVIFKRSFTQYYGGPVRLLLVVVVYSEGVCDHPCSSKALLMVGCRTKLLVVSLYSLIIGRDFWIGGSRCPRLWRLLYLASSPWMALCRRSMIEAIARWWWNGVPSIVCSQRCQ